LQDAPVLLCAPTFLPLDPFIPVAKYVCYSVCFVIPACFHIWPLMSKSFPWLRIFFVLPLPTVFSFILPPT
jgi:hypothetical protein